MRTPKPAKALVDPFPGRVFNPAHVWRVQHVGPHENLFRTYEGHAIGSDGAVVIAFTVPATIGAKLKCSVVECPDGTLGEQQPRIVTASETPLDFVGGYPNSAPTWIVVAADDPHAGEHTPIADGPNRGYIPLVAGKQMYVNIANVDPAAKRPELSIHMYG